MWTQKQKTTGIGDVFFTDSSSLAVEQFRLVLDELSETRRNKRQPESQSWVETRTPQPLAGWAHSNPITGRRPQRYRGSERNHLRGFDDQFDNTGSGRGRGSNSEQEEALQKKRSEKSDLSVCLHKKKEAKE